MAGRTAEFLFDVRILPRTRRRGDDFGDAEVDQSSPEDVAVNAVAVTVQPAGCGVVRKGLNHLLSRPTRGRMIRDVDMHDAPTLM